MKLSFSNLCTHSFYQVKISPNAHYVANVIGNRVVIRRLERNLSIVHVFENAKTINYMQWSPNSECILTINYDISKIQIHSVKDRKWTATIRDPVYPIASVQWTSDSKSIMCTTEMGVRKDQLLSKWRPYFFFLLVACFNMEFIKEGAKTYQLYKVLRESD